MATSISIVSAALLQLGKNPISDFDEDNDRARLCSNLYPIERDAILRENDWNCAMKRIVLAPMAVAPAYGFSAQFAIPSDYLRLISVGDRYVGSPECMRFKVQGRAILASGNVLPIEYVFRNDQEATWDSKLVEAMTSRMLWKLAYPVTQSTSLRDTLAEEYARITRGARAIDAQENPSDTLGDAYGLISGRF